MPTQVLQMFLTGTRFNDSALAGPVLRRLTTRDPTGWRYRAQPRGVAEAWLPSPYDTNQCPETVANRWMALGHSILGVSMANITLHTL